MKRFDLTQLSDDVLSRRIEDRASNEKNAIADVVAHIAEYDARRLHAPAGYPSMHAYCVRKLNISEGAAWRRIHVARKARQLPQIFEALADGRVHLSGMVLLVPRLTSD